MEGLQEVPFSFDHFKPIVPPHDRFWADPFVIFRNGLYYIFVEEFFYESKKGVISVITLTEEGQYSSSKVVLNKDYHLSYPFLFEEEGDLYMIPETSQNATIELYKCVDFPLMWELEKVLIDDIKTVDTTLLKHDSKYWLFTNEKVVKDSQNWDVLNVFYSDHLLNAAWKRHPQNPVVQDIEASRPGGSIFSRSGQMFRPGQNCLKHYGHGLTINEVIHLTETSYKEKRVQSIYPDWAKNIISTHTINSVNQLTIIDVLVRRKKLLRQI
ncbi:MAG: hypothetical protein R8G66_10320 [Cytophagales bacterium]|nr:hypothetical protein [Cytophagales bacterium]